MIEDTPNIADFLTSGAATLLSGQVGPPATKIQGLHVKAGALIVKGGAAMPVIDGKTSLKWLVDSGRGKYADLLAAPMVTDAEICNAIFIQGSPNFYHFLAFHSACLLFLNSVGADVPMRIATVHWAPSAVADFLAAFLPRLTGGRSVEIIKIDDGSYSLHDVILPLKSTPAAAVYFLRQVILPYVLGPPHPVTGTKPPDLIKLFVRREANLRRLTNQDEVENWFVARGYVSIDPGRISFEEQVLIFHSATHIVGVEGAAMVNILFAVNATRVVLLQSKAVASETFFSIFNKHFSYRFETVMGAVSIPRPISRTSDFAIEISQLEGLQDL